MATASNVKLRVPLGRALTYDELDVNFQELKYVITDYNQFVIDQNAVNTSLQTQLNDQTIEEAPLDTTQYARIDGTWQQVITTDSTWGFITGSLADQTDLNNRFTTVEGEVDTLQTDVGTLQTDVNNLEQDFNDYKLNATTTITSKNLQDKEYCFVLASGLTITLPANPVAGYRVAVGVQNYVNTVINRNGQNIMGLAENMTIDRENVTVELMFVNATEGWRIV